MPVRRRRNNQCVFLLSRNYGCIPRPLLAGRSEGDIKQVNMKLLMIGVHRREDDRLETVRCELGYYQGGNR